MKKNVTLFAVMAMGVLLHLCSTQLAAQGTDGQGVVLRVSIDGVNYDYNQGLCGYETATWGGSITDESCKPVQWGYGLTTDSLDCDSIPPDGTLSGKVAMIRRGTCEFGAKALAAEKAGAIMVLIANGTAATHGDDCNAVPMGAGAVGDQVTVPCFLVCRNIANQIDAALKAGKTVEICPLLPRLSAPFTTYAHATPVTQTQELSTLGFNFTNREAAAITNMTVTCEITEPGGNVVTISNVVPEIGVAADTLLFFEGYTPPAVLGEFNVKFYTDRYSEGRDTLTRSFVHTDYTFAVDNMTLNLDGGADRNDLFITDLLYQVGSLAAAGDAGGLATYCTFGIANIDSVYAPGNPIANTLTIYLYKADSDGNGLLDLDADFSDMEIVGIGTYEMKGTETEDVLVDAQILDINTNDPGVALEANTLYYISVQYDGLENGSGRNCAFSNTAYVPYLFFSNEAGASVATAPIKLGGTLSYWGDRTVVCRLQLDGYEPTIIGVKPNVLDATKYAVSPNPANEFMLLDLNLENQGDVVVTITNPMGQRLHSEVLKNFQNGQVSMDVQKIPSGTYMMTIRTAEGVGVKKVVICH